jgi:hypothetical protein
VQPALRVEKPAAENEGDHDKFGAPTNVVMTKMKRVLDEAEASFTHKI